MIFLSGSTFLGAETMSIPCTPTEINNITKVSLMSAWFDDLYATKNVTDEMTETIPTEWDFDTIMRAFFDGNTIAGNVNWSLSTTSHLLIKRKKKNEFKWITLQVQEVYDYDDFFITGIDKTAGTDSYVYAVVPVFNTVEGTYIPVDLNVKVDRIVILDKDEIWESIFTDGDLSIQYVVPNSVVETMYHKYPTVVSNSAAVYRQISMKVEMLPTTDEEGNCDVDAITDDERRIKYQQAFLDFLHNKKAKLVKAVDGRLFLVWVTTPASLSMAVSYEIEDITFGATEIGHPEDEEALWNAGLIYPSVTSNWWN
jgi:hypothetical protein